MLQSALEEQGCEVGICHPVVAASVLHATEKLDGTVCNIPKLFKKMDIHGVD